MLLIKGKTSLRSLAFDSKGAHTLAVFIHGINTEFSLPQPT